MTGSELRQIRSPKAAASKTRRVDESLMAAPGKMTSYNNNNHDYTAFANSIVHLRRFVKDNEWKGYDPYDGLNSRLTSAICGKSKWIRVFFVQFNKSFPVNLRSILRVKKGIHIKGMGLFASAFLRLHKIIGDKGLLEDAAYCLDFLRKMSLHGIYKDHCWGDYFTYQSARSAATADMTKTPDIINTVVCASAFLEHYELTGCTESLDIATSCRNFIVDTLYVETNEAAYFRYTPMSERDEVIYNASTHGAAFLSKINRYAKDQRNSEIAGRVMDYVISKQKPNGAWSYGQADGGEVMQIDFHQGFILDDLYDFISHAGLRDDRYTRALLTGAEFYRTEQFLPDGRARWRWPRVYPIDIHNQAQGIITFSRLSDLEPEYLDFAEKIAFWTIDNMQGKSGEFYYQNWKFFMNKIPYMRWGQAWMLLALSTLLDQLQGAAESQKDMSWMPESAATLSRWD